MTIRPGDYVAPVGVHPSSPSWTVGVVVFVGEVDGFDGPTAYVRRGALLDYERPDALSVVARASGVQGVHDLYAMGEDPAKGARGHLDSRVPGAWVVVCYCHACAIEPAPCPSIADAGRLVCTHFAGAGVGPSSPTTPPAPVVDGATPSSEPSAPTPSAGGSIFPRVVRLDVPPATSSPPVGQPDARDVALWASMLDIDTMGGEAVAGDVDVLAGLAVAAAPHNTGLAAVLRRAAGLVEACEACERVRWLATAALADFEALARDQWDHRRVANALHDVRAALAPRSRGA